MSPLPDNPSQLTVNGFVVRTVSCISSRIAELFCPFPMGAIVKTSSARKCSRTTSEIMWSSGSIGHRRTKWASSAWKILFLFQVVLWSPHGRLLRSWRTIRKPKSLWRVERSVTGPRPDILESSNILTLFLQLRFELGHVLLRDRVILRREVKDEH